MTRRTLILWLTVAVIVLAGIAGVAFSGDATAPAKANPTCAKFVDNNHDGACDSSAVCHKDGKCQGNCKNNAHCKDAMKNGKCDPSKCSSHQTSAVQGKTPAAVCPSMTNGTCKMTGKACPGKH